MCVIDVFLTLAQSIEWTPMTFRNGSTYCIPTDLYNNTVYLPRRLQAICNLGINVCSTFITTLVMTYLYKFKKAITTYKISDILCSLLDTTVNCIV